MVYHPYHNIEDISSEINKWASENNLVASFYDKSKSWYDKEMISMVVITTP